MNAPRCRNCLSPGAEPFFFPARRIKNECSQPASVMNTHSGAGNRTRTCTLLAVEPKSTESTNSTMPAYKCMPTSIDLGILSFSKIFVNSHPACLSNMMKKSLTMCPVASKITVVWCMLPGLPISDRAYFILHYRHFGRVSAFIAAWRFCYDFSQFWAFLNNFTWGQTHTPGRNF